MSEEADATTAAFEGLQQSFGFDDGVAVIDHRVGTYRLLARGSAAAVPANQVGKGTEDV
jgi:hypothetical protein